MHQGVRSTYDVPSGARKPRQRVDSKSNPVPKQNTVLRRTSERRCELVRRQLYTKYINSDPEDALLISAWTSVSLVKDGVRCVPATRY